MKLEDACFFEVKLMTNLDNKFKSKDSTLPTNVCLAKAMVFPVVIYGCQSWTIKKANCRIQTTEELMLLNYGAEKTLESPLDGKEIKPVNPKGNQSWVFIGRTGAEGEAPILWPHDAKSNSLEKTLMLGKIVGRRRKGRQRMKRLDDITDSMDMNFGKLWEIVKDREAWPTAVHGVAKSWKQLSNWTTITIFNKKKNVPGFISSWCKTTLKNFFLMFYLHLLFHF